MKNRKKKDCSSMKNLNNRSIMYIGYANQFRNLAGQILGFLWKIDDTGEHIGSSDVRTAASAFGCSESDVEDAFSMFMMAKQAEQKENRRDMSKTRGGLTSNMQGVAVAEGTQVLRMSLRMQYSG